MSEAQSFTVEAVLKANDAGFSKGFKAAESSVTGLANKVSGVGSLFSQVLGANVIGSAITSGIGAVSNAIGQTVSSAIDAGAKLEQSMGGVETLYQGAVNEVKQYAAEAAKAGISANSFAEQAVSFGATLKQSLGGDSVAAAKMANMAIMDMADNAAKMGTSIESVQQTYQSLARGNYAMLDNLKLGYGGTKSELERLLADAEKLPQAMGRKFDLTNFADVATAIHIVQENLGVAGVAAAEASTTFSGSSEAMKASWTNVLGAITSGELDITPQLENLASSTSAFLFNNFIPMVGRVMKALPSAIGTFISVAGETLGPQMMELGKTLIGGLSSGFSGNISQISQSIVGGLIGVVAGFKAFNFLKSFNPFGFFKKGAEEAVNGATNSVKRSKSTITQLFNGLSNVIKSLGTAIKTAATGIGQGLKTALSGLAPVIKAFGAALKTAGVANILAFGAAIGVAAVGIGAGVAIIAAGFTLLATQSQGISTILQAVGGVIVSVGTAIGTILNMALQGLAQALVIVAPVLPTIASAFAMLSPLITAAGAAISMIISSFAGLAPVVTALGSALSQVIGAISSGVAQIIVAVTPIVEIISNAFVQVVTVVSDAIVQIVQALAPFIPSITEMVEAVAPVLDSLIQAFTTLIEQISPIIDSITELFKTLGEQISSILDSAGGVVESFGSAIRNVLDGVAGIFESMGNAAKNAGQGVKLMAQGIKILVDLKLGDLVGTLGAVATGLAAIAGSGIASAGSGLQQAGTGLKLIATSAQAAGVVMQTLPSAFSTLSSSIGGLPILMTTVGSAMMTFASTVMTSFAGLTGSTASISALQSGMTALSTSMMMTKASAVTMSTGFSAVSTVIVALGAVLGTLPAKFTVIQDTIRVAKGSIERDIDTIKNAFISFGNTVSSVGGSVKAVVNEVTSTIKGIGNIDLFAAGKAIMDGFLKGLKSMWGSITGFVGDIAGWIKDHKGPISYDKVLLIPAGRAIMGGFHKSLVDNFKDVRSMITDVAPTLQKIMDKSELEAPKVDVTPFRESIKGLLDNDLGYSIDVGRLSAQSEITYRRDDEAQISVMKDTLKAIKDLIGRDVVVSVDGREIARATADDMTELQDRKTKIDNLLWGLT